MKTFLSKITAAIAGRIAGTGANKYESSDLGKDLDAYNGIYAEGLDITPEINIPGLITSIGTNYDSAGAQASWSRSDYIRIYENQELTVLPIISIAGYLSIAFYESASADSFISGVENITTEQDIMPPTNALYYRVSARNTEIENSYVKNKNAITFKAIKDVDDIPDASIKPEKLAPGFRYDDLSARNTLGGYKIEIKADYNLFNDVQEVEQGLINADGSEYNSGGSDPYYSRSKYITCYPDMSIFTNIVNTQPTFLVLAFYDINKTFISGVLGDAGDTVTATPEGAFFYRVAYKNGQLATDVFKVNSTYSKYVDYKVKFDNTNSQVSVDLTLPPYIYTTCNDINYTTSSLNGTLQRNYSAELYIDRLLNKLYLEDSEIYLSSNGISSDKIRISAPISGYQGTFNSTTDTGNDSEPKAETDVTVEVTGNFISSGTVTQRSSSATNGVTDTVYLLDIGDSITNKSGSNYGALEGGATVYWSWIKQLFNMDKIESGDAGTDYNLVTLGAQSIHTFEHTYDGVTKNETCFAEGRSGWKITDYMTKEWYNDTVGHYSGYNFFYDETEVGSLKFSLSKYLEHYRTLDDSGNRLGLGDPSLGDRILDDSSYNALSASDQKKFRKHSDNFNVCTPTHIILQLGTNDSNTASTSAANLQSIIDKVRAEGYTTINIGVSYPGVSGTFFPDLYPDIINSSINLDLDDKQKAYNTAYAGLDDDANNQYYLPIFYIQPTGKSVTLRNTDTPSSLVDGIEAGVKFGNVPELHPSVHAHLAWAYQYYSWIKWTLG